MSEPYWVPLGAAPLAPVVYPGTELAYAEITAAVTSAVTAEASATTVITAPAVTTDGSAILVEFYAPYGNPANTLNAQLLLNLWDAGNLGRLVFLQTPAAGVVAMPILARRKLTPAAGTYTYSVRAWVSSGTGTVGAGTGVGATYMPAYIRITKV